MSEYPHIAVIDPRTGERLKNWSGFIDPEVLYHESKKNSSIRKEITFLFAVLEFLQTHSLDDFSASKTPDKTKKPKKGSILDISEEEQLELAMKQSLNEVQKKNNNETTSVETNEPNKKRNLEEDKTTELNSKKPKLETTSTPTATSSTTSVSSTTPSSTTGTLENKTQTNKTEELSDEKRDCTIQVNVQLLLLVLMILLRFEKAMETF